MSTDPTSRRARGRRRRGRAFVLGFAATLGVLVLVGATGAAIGIAQGPRITDVQVDPAAAVSASGSRVIVTTTQALREVDAAQVTVEPAAAFTVDTSGRNVGVRFALPLRDDTDYTVTIDDAAGRGAGPAATLTASFRTPALEPFLLQRGGDAADDAIVRTELSGENARVVFTHPHIEDYRATSSHLVASVRTDDDRAAIVVTGPNGEDPRELALPDDGDGFVSNLQSADRGETIGFTFSSADLGAGGGLESVLFTASVAAGATAAPQQVGLEGSDSRVAQWRFVPDTDSILVLTFDGRLLLADADGAGAAPLGSALSIDGIARGSSLAVVKRFEGMAVVDLTDGGEQPLIEPGEGLGTLGSLNAVSPLPGEGAGTIRTYAVLTEAGAFASTVVAHVADDGAARVLLDASATDAVVQTCVSPSGRYAAVLTAPDAAANPYDLYQLPLPERVVTRVVEVETAEEVTALDGVGLSWCQVPPA